MPKSSKYRVAENRVARFFFIAFLLCLCGLAKGEQKTAINAVQISVDQGLSHTDVTSFAQDKDGYLWIGTYSGLCRYDGTRIDVFNAGNSRLEGSRISALLYADDRLYIGGETSGVSIMDPSSGVILRNIQIPLSYVNSMFRSSDGAVWVCTNDGISMIKEIDGGYDITSWSLGEHVEAGKCLSDGKTLILALSRGLILFDKASGIQTMVSDFFGTDILDLGDDRFLITSYSGTFLYDYRLRKLNKIDDRESMSACVDGDGTIWVGTLTEGVFAYNDDFEMKSWHQVSAPGINKSDVVRLSSIFCDESSVLWIGSIGQGCLRASVNSRYFHFYQLGKYSSTPVTTMFGDSMNNLWASTIDGKLYVIDGHENTKQVNEESLRPFFLEKPVSAVYEDTEHHFWIGSWEHGFITLSPSQASRASQGNSFSPHKHSAEGYSIFKFAEDPLGSIWISTSIGVLRYDRKSVRLIESYRYESTNESSLIDDYSTDILITSDEKGFIVWVGSKLGITRIQCNSEGIVKKIDRMNGEFVSVIHQDVRGEIWVATLGGGLSRLTSPPGDDSPSWERFTSSSYPFPNDEFESLKEDNDGIFWIGGKGIIRFNPITHEIRHYSKSDGLQSNVFKIWDSAILSDGRLAFGGINGVNIFEPDELKSASVIPKVKITSVIANANEIANKTVLSHTENNLSFEFAAMDFENPEGNQYRFMLSGADKEWHTSNGLATSAKYLNLEPGSYSFIVYGASSGGVWNPQPATVSIKIKPPFYATHLAYVFYVLLLLSIAAISILAIGRQRERQHQFDRNRDELKLHTDFLHEIKTPLTLITAPIEELLQNSNLGKSTQNRLKLVQQSVHILNKHIEELTYLRKMDNNKIHLHVCQEDLAGFVRQLLMLFTPVTDSRKITLDTTGITNDVLPVYFDKVQFEKVIINLMSNAVKFSPEKGGLIKVAVKEEHDSAIISISNIGIGIHPDDLTHIFNRFRQGRNNDRGGMGIGLAISKHIVDLHGGRISAKSIPGGETTFEVELPLGSGHFAKECIFAPSNENELDPQLLEGLFEDVPSLTQKSVVERLYTVLVVEDNKYLRDYFCQFLSLKFNILTARDGQDGYERAIADQPDIILSDVVMPVMGGLELCSRIKGNPDTSHIPVILISARDLPVHKIEGFQNQADDYFTKPFNVDLLVSRITNLISIRESMRKNFSGAVALNPSEVTATPADDKYLRKCIGYIEKNIADADYGVDELCVDMGMSRPQFYRKIKTITGLSAIQFMRSIRLKRAAQLLKSKNVSSVSDAMYAVGFNNLSYFSKIFFEEFGVLPKDYK